MTSWQDVPSEVHSYYKSSGEAKKKFMEKERQRREIERKMLVQTIKEREGMKTKKPTRKKPSIFRRGLNFARVSAVAGLTSLLLSPQNYDVPELSGYKDVISSSPSIGEVASEISNYGISVANGFVEIGRYFGEKMETLRIKQKSPSAVQVSFGDLEKALVWNFPSEQSTKHDSDNLYKIILENKKVEALRQMEEKPEEIMEQQRTINPIFDLNEYQSLFSQKEISLKEIDDAKTLSQKLLNEPLDAIADIAKARADYIKGNAASRAGLVKSLERFKPFIPTVKSIFNEHGVPEELIYLALVESNFIHDAESYAGAVGAWQFREETGKRNGLIIENVEIEEDEFEDSKSIRTYALDERRNPILAAEATAKELSHLHKIFGDWSLATSAYNIGENGIQRRLVGRENWATLMKDGRIDEKERETIKELIKGKTSEDLYLAFGEELEGYDRKVRAWYKQGHPKISDEELESIKVTTPKRSPNHRERITYFPELLARIEAMKEIDPETLYKPASRGHFKIVTINQRYENHRMVAGETVWDISKRFAPNSSQDGIELLMGRIAKASGIDDMNKVRIGQKLNIPYTPKNLHEFSIMNGFNPDYMRALNPHIELHARFPEKVRIVTYNIPENEVRDAVTKL